MDRFSLHFDSLNPGQTAVVGFDQPLYVVVKRIKWNWPTQYGKKLVAVLGALHIKKDNVK